MECLFFLQFKRRNFDFNSLHFTPFLEFSMDEFVGLFQSKLSHTSIVFTNHWSLAKNVTSMYQFSFQGSEVMEQSKEESLQEWEVVGDYHQTVLRMQPAIASVSSQCLWECLCTYHLSEYLCTRPVQEHAGQNPSMDGLGSTAFKWQTAIST